MGGIVCIAIAVPPEVVLGIGIGSVLPLLVLGGVGFSATCVLSSLAGVVGL
jgi:hypothetical protein